jgi:hypothetical protein
MPILFSLLLLVTGASRSSTEWMRPEQFHLAIGMPRESAISALEAWNPKPGKDENQIVVDYSDERAMTLDFRKGRLNSVRFELFMMLPEVRKAFESEREYLRESRGEPPKATKSILIYDNALPNVMVVVTDDPNSEQGKRGLGVLAVRYYDPR